MQFPEAVTEFLRFCVVERQLSEHTLQAYTGDLGHFGKWLPAEMLVADISKATLKDYLAELVDKRRMAVATVRRRFACLRSFFRRLTDLGEASNPFGSWRLQLPRRKRLPRALSRSEISALLISFKGPERAMQIDPDTTLATAVRLMVSTGIRVGELCQLRVDDIAPDGGSIKIHGKGSRDRVAYIGDPTQQDELKKLTSNIVSRMTPDARRCS